MSETIYIVGFPKSGNTWLTRLLADVLNAPVVKAPMRGFVEMASEINAQISATDNAALRVAKVHFLPQPLIDEVDAQPTRVVYIHRNPYDVAISAFCYFTRWSETDLNPDKRGLRASLRRFRAVRALDRFVHRLMTRGLPGVEEAFGTWASHVEAWLDANARTPGLRFYAVSYEALKADPHRELDRMITCIDVPLPHPDHVAAAIDRQSFKSVREHYHRMAEDAAVPHGREFALRFYRGGRVGDGERLLTPRSQSIITRSCAAAMSRLHDLCNTSDLREAA